MHAYYTNFNVILSMILGGTLNFSNPPTCIMILFKWNFYITALGRMKLYILTRNILL